MSFHGTIHSADLIRKGTTLDDYKTVLDLRICMGYALAGENDEHICAVFPDGITTEIGFAMFQVDLEILYQAGFRGEVVLETDILQLTKYKLTDDGVVKLEGEIVYGEEDSVSVLRGTFSDGQSVASLGVSVGVDDLNEQYAWLIEQATAIRQAGELTVMPEPLIGLLEYFEGMREIIREVSPDLCPLLDAPEEKYADIFKYLGDADGDEWYPERIEALKADKRTLQRLDIAYKKFCEHMKRDAAMDLALWKVIGRKEQDTDWRLLKEDMAPNETIWGKCPHTIQYIDNNVAALEALGIDVTALIADNESLVKIVNRTGEIIVAETDIPYDDAVYLAIKEVMI